MPRSRPSFLAAALLASLAAAPAFAQTSLSYYTVSPCRLIDTRNAAGIAGGPALANGVTRQITIAGQCGVSTAAQAVSANVTVVGATTAGSVSLLPTGTAPNGTKTVTFLGNQTRSNNAVLRLGQGGALAATSSLGSGQVHLIIDVSGYFANATAATTMAAPPAFTPAPGSYFGPQQVTLATTTPGATIRYTTDGSAPGPSSAVYSGPITLSSASSTLRAIADAPGLATSPIAGGTYTLNLQPTLFVASMTPQNAALSLGTGSATLLLSGDQTTAVLRFSYSNLTGPLTGAHIHGPNGTILFDIDAATPQADGSLVWTITAVPPLAVADILAALRSGQLYINLHTAQYPSGEIKGFFLLSTGSQSWTPPAAPPALPPGPPTANDAARFLLQATYGPKFAEIGALQQMGFDTWLTLQLAAPQTSHLSTVAAAIAAGETEDNDRVMESFWQQAVTGNDQLRQRTVLALSEIFVISDVDADLENNPRALAAYLDLLGSDAFGNVRTILQDVTLSPAMGVYLDMLGNDKENPDTGQNPNENYAREFMQLFSIGLNQLHPDGTLALDGNGLPQPTYDQNVVIALAKVFTGWSYGGNDTTDFDAFYDPPNQSFAIPMIAWPDHHSTAAKTLFGGLTLPAGQTAELDLQQAVNAIFNHANIGPFLCRELIQRLVTSNPSPGYVYRCANAFANNGQGVRGDMKAILRAILRDYEARSTQVIAQQGYGHLREPIVRFGGLLRSYSAAAPSGKYRITSLEDPQFGLGQNPLRSPTVFNFFEPGFALPGPIAQAGLASPEFQITNEIQVIGNANTLGGVIFYGFDPGTDPNDVIQSNYSELYNLLVQSGPGALVDRLNLQLMGGAMSAAMRADLVQMLNDLAAQSTDPLDQVRTALWIVEISPEGAVQK